jgi:hypothetical protein
MTHSTNKPVDLVFTGLLVKHIEIGFAALVRQVGAPAAQAIVATIIAKGQCGHEQAR